MNNNDLLTLISNTGEETRFLEIAGVVYNDGYYSLLMPVLELEGIDDDQVFIYKVEVNPMTKETIYNIVLDDELINEVFNEYQKLLQESEY